MHPPSVTPRPTKSRRRPALQHIAALTLVLLATTTHAAPLSLDDRIACQTALDDVRWSQSLWPDVNPGPKPPRADVLPDTAIRAKVLDQLRREQVLLGLYGERIDTPALQAELDRMARATRAPDQLRDLHAALGNDADMIGECLARPTLVERRLRQRYDADTELHADVRANAEAALAAGESVDTAKDASDAQANIVTYLRVDNPAEHARAALEAGETMANADIALDAEEWDHLLAGLDRAAAREAEAAAPQLEESDTALYYRRVLYRSGERLVLQVRTWEKRSFDSWWRSEAERWQPLETVQDKVASAHTLTLPPMHATASTLTKSYGPGDVMPDNTWRTEAGAPTSRISHTAVMAGSKMIVWGGDAGDELSSGGVFDLTTGTWKPTSRINAPAKRDSHTAIWTGDVMIVWGGRGATSTDFFDSGASYNPETDTWTALPTVANTIDARAGHTAVWTGTEMIVWGGYGETAYKNTGARYRPATSTWASTPTDGAPAPRGLHTAVWASGQNRMIVWGGLGGGNSVELHSGGIFDPTGPEGSWEPTPPNGPAARYRHTAVWAESLEMMIVWGGSDGPYLNSGGRLRRSGDHWAWSETSDAIGTPTGRIYHTAVWTGDRMLIFGGVGTAEPAVGASYDPVGDTWTDMPPPRRIRRNQPAHCSLVRNR